MRELFSFLPRGVDAIAAGAWGGPAVASDPLAAFDDTFDSGSSDMTTRGWSTHKPATLSLLDTVDTASGYYQCTVIQGNLGATGSHWYNNRDGLLRYHTVTATSFDARARVTVLNTALDGLPTATQYRIAALAAHDPDRTDPNTDLNYVHIGPGVINGDYGVEYKTNVNSVSTFPYTPFSAVHPWTSDIRIVRTGSNFAMMARTTAGADLLSEDSWATLTTFVRADLPATLQIGIMAYANPTVHDVVGRFHEFRIRTP